MGKNSKIAWTDHTFNAWIGCSKVSAGCANCYAELDNARRKWVPGWGAGQPRKRTSEAYWRQPLAWNREAAAAGVRRRVFANSLSDVFDPDVPDEWRRDLFSLIEECVHLDWLILTKRPEKMRGWYTKWCTVDEGNVAPLPHVWLGVTAENQGAADERVPILLSTPAAVRFISYEPAIGPVDFDCYPSTGCPTGWLDEEPCVDWLIVGGESGSRARPFDVEWGRRAISQCHANRIPAFMKQLGANPIMEEPRPITWPCEDPAGRDPAEWPEDLRVREFPAVL